MKTADDVFREYHERQQREEDQRMAIQERNRREYLEEQRRWEDREWERQQHDDAYNRAREDQRQDEFARRWHGYNTRTASISDWIVLILFLGLFYLSFKLIWWIFVRNRIGRIFSLALLILTVMLFIPSTHAFSVSAFKWILSVVIHIVSAIATAIGDWMTALKKVW